MYSDIKKVVYNALENQNNKNNIGYTINTFLIILIIANAAAFILESEPSIKLKFNNYFDLFEKFSVIVFLMEYVLRLWSISEKGGGTFKESLLTRLNWMKSPMAIIDLVAILPIVLQHIFPIDLRILRLLRLLRILKLSRYSSSLRMLLTVMAREGKSLSAMLFLLFVLIIMAASGIYLVESNHQPEHFGSVPRAMWWAVVTLTTVGYGDVTPITPLGKAFGACITILGIGIAALPAGILAGGFAEELSMKKQRNEDDFASFLQENLDISIHELDKYRKRAKVSRDAALKMYKQIHPDK